MWFYTGFVPVLSALHACQPFQFPPSSKAPEGLHCSGPCVALMWHLCGPCAAPGECEWKWASWRHPSGDSNWPCLPRLLLWCSLCNCPRDGQMLVTSTGCGRFGRLKRLRCHFALANMGLQETTHKFPSTCLGFAASLDGFGPICGVSRWEEVLGIRV